MEMNNSSLIVDESVRTLKGIESLHFNALKKPKLMRNGTMGDKDQSKLLNNQTKPIVIPKSEALNPQLSSEEVIIYPNLGDPNIVGLPNVVTENLSTNNQVCDIKEVDINSASPSTIVQVPQNFAPFSSRYQNSVRSWRSSEGRTTPYVGRPFSDTSSQISRHISDVASIRSIASIGMGSTDGKKMIIRKVPHSPSELFNIINPPT